ncbi:SDR family NAD(P)-dependent oxidoreductase [Streptomyces melanogenes]|uniref:SDR family NAD(P)-dependent oxidoreductase n=1 Tax=Streptomyces melanogenes TaxID=67326 RepID=UPI00167E2064|nr:SDR family NAD(P)-dependent oxidoreductase [Streptomyces melanogenes]GGP90754.1 hypothetical protein GCM10010278_81360 [Streptomyces melanogenes]
MTELPPAAVVGMGLVTPGARNPGELWTRLIDGTPVFRAPGRRWPLTGHYDPDPTADDRSYAPRSGFITSDDPGEPPRDVDLATLRLRHALAQALGPVRQSNADRCVLVTGCTSEGSQHLHECLVLEHAAAAGPEPVAAVRGALRYAGEGRAAEHLPHSVVARAMTGLLPPGTEMLNIDAACSSGLYAVDLGMRRLGRGRCDLVVYAGLSTVTWRDSVLFAKLGAFTRSGRVRVFDRAADGTLFSEAAVAVVLKDLGRDRAEGDEILGVLRGAGVASDGRGRAVHAPNPEGQRRTLDRALAAADIGPSGLDLVVAHGTGTAKGDRVELAVLGRLLAGSERKVPAVSNKSVLGHTAWAAGLVSLIHALLVLRHGTVPAQAGFSTPTEVLDDDVALHIPTAPVPFPARPDRPRTVGVSAFGFGGATAHVVVSDDHPRLPERPRGHVEHDPVVLVGWSACLPSDPTAQRIARWLREGASPPPTRFTAADLRPEAGELRLAPKAAETVDPAQLLAVRAAHRLREHFSSGLWDRLRPRTALIAAHVGPTRTGIDHTLRCSLGLLEADGAAETPELRRFTEAVRANVPPSSRDTYCAQLPSLASGRPANVLDLHGPNVTVDTGPDSACGAVRAASDYLATGAADMAMVVTADAKTQPPWQHVAQCVAGDQRDLAEGAFALALMRHSRACAEQLPVLAVLDEETAPARRVPLRALAPADRTYLAGDSVFAVLCAVQRGKPVLLTTRDPMAGRRGTLAVRPTAAGPPGTPDATAQTVAPPTAPALVRHVVALAELAPEPARQELTALPDDCLVVTNLPLPADLAAGRQVLTTASPETAHGVREGAVADAVRDAVTRPHHVRVLARVGARESREELRDLLSLHDLAFLAARELLTRQPDPASYAALLLDAVHTGAPRPGTGLFTTLVKSLAMERPGLATLALAAACDDLGTGLRLLAEEASLRHPLRTVYVEGGRRFTETAIPAPSAPGVPTPWPRSVLVAGGARGATGAVLSALAERCAPAVWVLGSNDPDAHPPWVHAGTDASFAALRPSWMRAQLKSGHTGTPRELSQAFDRMVHARATRATLTHLEHLCDPGRVRYRRCDLTDSDAVREAVGTALTESGGIDLVLFTAGLMRPTLTARQSLDGFRAVRAVKVLGHAHLSEAFVQRPPARWCNFGSVLGFTGQDSDAAYAGANAYLAWSAAHRTSGATHEWTIGWNRWGESGMASGPARNRLPGHVLSLPGMPDADGAALFLSELRAPAPDPYIIHLNAETVALTEQRLPGSSGSVRPHRPTTTSPRPAPAGPGLLDATRRTSSGTLHARVSLSEPAFAPTDHQVSGRPTLAAVHCVEIAVQAAMALAPGRQVTGIERIRFRRFIHVHEDGAGTLDVCATWQDRRNSRTVAVQLSRGVPLVELRVLLDHTPRSATPPRPVEASGPPGDDPYCAPDSPVRLTGPLDCLRDLHITPGAASARVTLAPSAALAGYRTPALLLDAVLRTAALAVRANALSVLTSIAGIVFLEPGNDSSLAALRPTVTARVNSPAWTGDGWAVHGDRVLLHVSGVAGVPWPPATTVST